MKYSVARCSLIMPRGLNAADEPRRVTAASKANQGRPRKGVLAGERSSVDDLIRSQQERLRDDDAESFRCREVDDELELRGLFDR